MDPLKEKSPSNELDRLAAGGNPIKESAGGPTPMKRVRIQSLSIPKARQNAMSLGADPTKLPPIRPPRPGALKNAAAREHVDAHTRTVKGKKVQVSEHTRKGDAPKKHKEQFATSEAGQKQAAEDLAQWKIWKSAEPGSKERRRAYKKLLANYTGVMDSTLRHYASAIEFSGLPPSALKSKQRQIFMDALKKYDPSRGAALKTFVNWQLQGVKRYVQDRQNILHVPDRVLNRIADVRRARETLMDDLGRSPTSEEISSFLDIPLKTVIRVETEVPRATGSSLSSLETSPIGAGSDVDEVSKLFRKEDLADKEWQYLQYARKKAKTRDDMKPSKVKDAFGWSSSEVSRVKTSLTRKIRKALGEV
jgi:DNA-directed RNA polymerase specialized sigma subunit